MRTIKHTVNETFPISSADSQFDLEVGTIVRNIGEIATVKIFTSNPLLEVRHILTLECEIELEGKIDTVAIPLVTLVNLLSFLPLRGMLGTHPAFYGCENFTNGKFIDVLKSVGAFKVTALETREIKGSYKDGDVLHDITYIYVVPTLEKV